MGAHAILAITAKSGTASVTRRTTGSGATILVVEDNAQLRGVLAEMLESKGYRVLTAGDYDEALRLADHRETTIDLLLSDLDLAGSDGLKGAERLAEFQPNARFLYMSGHSLDRVSRPGGHLRERAFIQKPFSSDELVERIRELLDLGTTRGALWPP